MKYGLAIVISAYKGKFIRKTIESIAGQTNMKFRLYICDDASPDYLWKELAGIDLSTEQLVYNRFDSNLGGKSLTAQYHRCIDLCEEPWLWLFSDDDIMGPNCVETFYSALDKTNAEYDVYRFNTTMYI